MRKAKRVQFALAGFVIPMLTASTVFAQSSALKEWDSAVNNMKNAPYIQLQENDKEDISFTDPSGKATRTSVISNITGTLHSTGKGGYDEFAKVGDNQGDHIQLYVKAGKEFSNDGSGWKASKTPDEGSVLSDEFSMIGSNVSTITSGSASNGGRSFTMVPTAQSLDVAVTNALSNMGNEKTLMSNSKAWSDVLNHSTLSLQIQTAKANGKEVITNVKVSMAIHLSPSEAVIFLGFTPTSSSSNSTSSDAQSNNNSGGPMDITFQESFINTFNKAVVPIPSGLNR